MNKARRITELVSLITVHCSDYYNDDPTISDAEFDALVDELRVLDPNHPELFSVGAPIPDNTPWEVGSHQIPMTSLDKVNTKEEIIEWATSRGATWFSVQEKCDGISLSAEWVDSCLDRAILRGAGKEGEIITRNAQKMQGIPRVVNDKFSGAIRGEVMFLDNDFDTYNTRSVSLGWRKEPYKNPRNGASGCARRFAGNGCDLLTGIFYDIVGVEFKTHTDKMVYMRDTLGLKVPFFKRVNIEELIEIYNEYENGKRESLPYEIDGLVIKVDSVSECQEIEDRLQKSSRKTKNPKSQVAWKFANEGRVTKMVDIEWQLGLGGRITPVGIVEPVNIGGVTIRRVSLAVPERVNDLKLFKGCRVLVTRRNDVIPYIEENLDVANQVHDGYFPPPTHCTSCKSSLVVDGKYLECRDTKCKALIKGTLRRWIQKTDVKFFGMKIIEGLVDANIVHDIADLYLVNEQVIASVSSPGVAKRAWANLHSNKNFPLHIVIGSLGINGFGRSLSRSLVEAGFDTVDKMIAMTHSNIANIDQFGEERAIQIVAGLNANEPVIRRLAVILTIQEAITDKVISGILGLQTFCITGKLSKSKKEYEALINSNGGAWSKRVSKELDYLIVADPSSGSSKLQKAAKLGVKIIDEDDFLEMIAS